MNSKVKLKKILITGGIICLVLVIGMFVLIEKKYNNLVNKLEDFHQDHEENVENYENGLGGPGDVEYTYTLEDLAVDFERLGSYKEAAEKAKEARELQVIMDEFHDSCVAEEQYWNEDIFRKYSGTYYKETNDAVADLALDFPYMGCYIFDGPENSFEILEAPHKFEESTNTLTVDVPDKEGTIIIKFDGDEKAVITTNCQELAEIQGTYYKN